MCLDNCIKMSGGFSDVVEVFAEISPGENRHFAG